MAKIRVGINGMGRIGRTILREYFNRNIKSFDVVAVNNPGNIETYIHLLKHDSVHGKFKAEFKYDESRFVLFSLSHLFKYLLVIPLHNSIIVLEDRTFYFSYLKNGNMLSSIIFFSNLTLK